MIPIHRLDNAISYALDEKKNSRSQNVNSLCKAVDYALNKDKTEQDLFRSALSCTCETAFEDMCVVKRIWHKEKGVQGFHLVQSFAAREVTPELAHQIGLEFAEQLLGGNFQVVVSTHLNTGHIHNHLVWNSVAISDGRKYRSNYKTYVTKVRQISDELCRKYGLSVIHTEKSEQVARPYAQWLAEQEDRPTWKTAIQQDINAAITISVTWKQFLRTLEQQGYTFLFDRKHPALKPPNKERPVRFKTLGRQYTLEAIQRRILYPKSFHRAGKEQPSANHFFLLLGEKPSHRITGLRALYFSYLYKVGALSKKPRYPSYAVREDIRKLDKRIEQAEFIFKHHIKDRGQLAVIQQKAEEEITVLVKDRQKLYRREPGSPQIAVLTEKLKRLRYTVKLCRSIEINSVEIEKRLQMAQLESQKCREEKKLEEQQKEAQNWKNQKRR
ncbi:relaxase/mobilization nuclease domain-containing protein [[Clostridium] leptum]|nr:relaxase/mobilization nuclease domain-containing protein [[Clostridium] leptum]